MKRICLCISCKISSLWLASSCQFLSAVGPVCDQPPEGKGTVSATWLNFFLSNPQRSSRTFRHYCANTQWIRFCDWHFSLWNILASKHLQKQREHYGLLLILKGEKSVIFSPYFHLPFLQWQIYYLSLISNQYECPSEIKSANCPLHSGQDFQKGNSLHREIEDWPDGNQRIEESLPLMSKQKSWHQENIDTSTVLHFWDIKFSIVVTHTWNRRSSKEWRW